MDAYKSSMEPTDVLFGTETPKNGTPQPFSNSLFRRLQDTLQSFPLTQQNPAILVGQTPYAEAK